VQHAGAPVISKAAPGGQNAGLREPRQLFYVGKAAQEFVIVLDDRGHAGLLQHDFGEPDAVGIVVGAPRKVAGVSVIPSEEMAAEFQVQGVVERLELA